MKLTARSLRVLPMNELSIATMRISSMNEAAMEKVRKFTEMSLKLPQVDIGTLHVIHAGMYARTIMVPAGVAITGALIKIATILIISGDMIAYIGDEGVSLQGYNVLPASRNRKQAFLAQTDTFMTMIFPSDAKTIEGAEEQFTDETEMLFSRNDKSANKIIITEE